MNQLSGFSEVSSVFLLCFSYLDIVKIYYFFSLLGPEHGQAVFLDLLSVCQFYQVARQLISVRCSSLPTSLAFLGARLTWGTSLPWFPVISSEIAATEQLLGGEYPKCKIPRLHRQFKPGSLNRGGQKRGRI